MLAIHSDLADALGFDLQAAVDLFASALAAHADTVNIPAPTAHPLVEQIVRQHAGHFTILPLDQETKAPDPG